MRVLLVHPGPEFSVSDVYEGWREGLIANGCQVAAFNLHDRLAFYSDAGRVVEESGEFVRLVSEEGAARLASKGIEAACFEWWPDVVVLISCFYVPLDILAMIRARRMKVVLVHTESPYEDDRQLQRAAVADLNVINDPTNIDRFKEVAPTVYVPHAYRPQTHRPGPVTADLRSDLAFVGTGYASRVRFLEACDLTGLDVLLAGNWQATADDSPLRKFVAHDIEECCDNARAVEIYRSTLASVNIYRREAERPALAAGWSMGPREVEMAACGTFYLTEARGENRSVLPMVPSFDGPGDFDEKLRWFLAHGDQRRSIADQARTAVAGRTFTAHAAQVLRRLEGP